MSFIDLFAKGQHSSVRVRLRSSVQRSPEMHMNATSSRFSAGCLNDPLTASVSL